MRAWHVRVSHASSTLSASVLQWMPKTPDLAIKRQCCVGRRRAPCVRFGATVEHAFQVLCTCGWGLNPQVFLSDNGFPQKLPKRDHSNWNTEVKTPKHQKLLLLRVCLLWTMVSHQVSSAEQLIWGRKGLASENLVKFGGNVKKWWSLVKFGKKVDLPNWGLVENIRTETFGLCKLRTSDFSFPANILCPCLVCWTTMDVQSARPGKRCIAADWMHIYQASHSGFCRGWQARIQHSGSRDRK